EHDVGRQLCVDPRPVPAPHRAPAAEEIVGDDPERARSRRGFLGTHGRDGAAGQWSTVPHAGVAASTERISGMLSVTLKLPCPVPGPGSLAPKRNRPGRGGVKMHAREPTANGGSSSKRAISAPRFASATGRAGLAESGSPNGSTLVRPP